MSDFLENRTYDEIQIGDSAFLTRTIRQEDVLLFAALSGDINPAHLNEEYAAQTPFGKTIAHGMLSTSLISTLLGTQFPGPGTIYIDQQVQFRRPVNKGDTLTVTVTCKEKNDEKKRLILNCECKNQEGVVVTRGVAEVVAPTQKLRIQKTALPPVMLDGKPFSPVA